MFQLWHWTMADVEDLDFDEFCLLADTVQEIYKKEAEAARRRR